MGHNRVCADCRKQAPETETSYTLIDAKHGWRNIRRKMPDGQYSIEWRCPECWLAHKKNAGNAPILGAESQPRMKTRR